MSIFSFILGMSTGGLPRDSVDLAEFDETPESGRWVRPQDSAGKCNGCGWDFHPIHINCRCPRGCGGTVY